MAYEDTRVPVDRTQAAIRKLIMQHGGSGTAFVSDIDPITKQRTEGFYAEVMIEEKPYAIRIMARAKKAVGHLTDRQSEKFVQQEERRIWRVLFYYLKNIYVAADSGGDGLP